VRQLLSSPWRSFSEIVRRRLTFAIATVFAADVPSDPFPSVCTAIAPSWACFRSSTTTAKSLDDCDMSGSRSQNSLRLPHGSSHVSAQASAWLKIGSLGTRPEDSITPRKCATGFDPYLYYPQNSHDVSRLGLAWRHYCDCTRARRKAEHDRVICSGPRTSKFTSREHVVCSSIVRRRGQFTKVGNHSYRFTHHGHMPTCHVQVGRCTSQSSRAFVVSPSWLRWGNSLDGHCWYRLLRSAILLAASARVPALPILSVYAVNVDDLPPRYLRLTRNAT